MGSVVVRAVRIYGPNDHQPTPTALMPCRAEGFPRPGDRTMIHLGPVPEEIREQLVLRRAFLTSFLAVFSGATQPLEQAVPSFAVETRA